jgi:hypothetical protein
MKGQARLPFIASGLGMPFASPQELLQPATLNGASLLTSAAP